MFYHDVTAVFQARDIEENRASTYTQGAGDPMDLKLFFATFTSIFLAELGDKTQLATMSLSASEKKPWLIFGASALALVTSSALAVLFGEAVTKAIPAVWIRRGAGTLFIVLGALMLFRNDS